MIVVSSTRHLRWLAVAAVAIACGAHAACNNPNNWLQAPGPDTKIFIGYKQEQPPGFADADGTTPFPPPLPKDMLGKEDSGALPNGEVGITSYYEPDPRGGWRICRKDFWFQSSLANKDSAKDAISLAASNKYSATNATLARLAKNHQAFNSTIYWYDHTGRIERVSEGDLEKPGAMPVDLFCYRYDAKDRLTLEVEPRTTKKCPKNDPDPRDSWSTYKYDLKFKGEDFSSRHGHGGSADGSWEEQFDSFLSPSSTGPVLGNAKADSKNGVTEIYGSTAGKLDDNAANTVVNSFGRWDGSTYVFLEHPVPLAVIDNPDLIYKYRRRRQTYIEGDGIRLYELFEPNEHIVRNRYYLLDGYVMRQEQLNAQGKVTRVITIDGYRQPRPGPHPDVDDKRLTDKDLHVHGHQIYHRVYDIDTKGQPRLVAVSWGPGFWLPGMKETPVDWAQVVYGTPDGKERWKTQEDFEQAFGTSERAAQVFPDKQGVPGSDGQ